MASPRPLPAVIGPTENALRALLAQTLSTTRIKTYRSWVVINAASAADSSAEPGGWRLAVADALKIEPREVDEVIAQLRSTGLVGDDSLTEAGQAEFLSARSAVATSTARLVEGLGEEEQEIARRVLDHIRQKANEGLCR